MSDIKNHWAGFLNAIGKAPNPSSTSTLPFENTSSKIGVSGFLDLKPSNSNFQARYDAMSGSWEGVSASENATLNSKSDKTEFMPYASK
jgi:hypothetical protein